MYEKVNMFHPDKVADRIAGAIVDRAYSLRQNPHIAVEVLIGHEQASVIVESDCGIMEQMVKDIIERIAGKQKKYSIKIESQDEKLNLIQRKKVRCGDNGIFRGMPITGEQRLLTKICDELECSDGKYIIEETCNGYDIIICQSKMDEREIRAQVFETLLPHKIHEVAINPIGYWEGGLNVDSGATNRKLGSDMGNAVTGGGLHGKDLSKADVSVNIMCHILAQKYDSPIITTCGIGDDNIEFVNSGGQKIAMDYEDVVKEAYKWLMKEYGSFEKFAERGLIK